MSAMADRTQDKPKLLSGGNPQIPKGYGDAPVQAYVQAVPGWKQAVCRSLDEIVTRAVPDVQKAVKWNTPLYGTAKDSWFMSYHCFARYVKVGFFQGAEMDPVPPVKSKVGAVRYVHIHEDDTLDEDLFASWTKQASQLPGEKM